MSTCMLRVSVQFGRDTSPIAYCIVSCNVTQCFVSQHCLHNLSACWVHIYPPLHMHAKCCTGLSEKGSLQSTRSPCYLNRMDASETAVGFGKTVLELLRNLINTYSPFSQGYPLEVINCIAPPSKEYTFPHDLYH